MKRRYYVVIGRNKFAENFVHSIQQRLDIRVSLAAQNRKLNGCRVFEVPTDVLCRSADDIERLGNHLMEYLEENGWIDNVCSVIKNDCRRMKSNKVVINFMVTSRCRYTRMPGFVFYWEARSKKC